MERAQHHSRVLQGTRNRRQGHVEPAMQSKAGLQSPRDKRTPWDQLSGANIRPSQPTLRPLTPQDVTPDKAQTFLVQTWDIAPSLRPFTPEIQAWDAAPAVRPCTPQASPIEQSPPVTGTSQPSCRRRAKPAASLPPLQGGVRHRSSRHARHRVRGNEKGHTPGHARDLAQNIKSAPIPKKVGLVELAKTAVSTEATQARKTADVGVSGSPSDDSTAKRCSTGIGDSRKAPVSDGSAAAIWTTAPDGTQCVAWDRLVATLATAAPKDVDSTKYDAFLSPWPKPKVAFTEKITSRTKGSSLPALTRSCRSPDLTIEVADLCDEQAATDKHVSFSDKGDEVFDAFTPYGCVYGEHPSGFHFDDSGHMVAASPDARAPDSEAIDAGDLVECIASCGVGYRTIPQFAARFDDLRTLHIGERVKIEERSGEWLRDSIGWFPLFINDTVVVELVRQNVPHSRLRRARRGVMVLEVDKDDEVDKEHQ